MSKLIMYKGMPLIGEADYKPGLGGVSPQEGAG